MATTEQEYQQDKERRENVTRTSLEVTEQSKPTPTQEENDKLALGLMHPDEKANPDNPQMPPVGVQQAYLAMGEPVITPEHPIVAPPPDQKPPPGSEPPPLEGAARRAEPGRPTPQPPERSGPPQPRPGSDDRKP